jgi:hypothetical protein
MLTFFFFKRSGEKRGMLELLLVFFWCPLEGHKCNKKNYIYVLLDDMDTIFLIFLLHLCPSRRILKRVLAFLEKKIKKRKGGEMVTNRPLTFLTRKSVMQHIQRQHKINEGQQKIKINHMLNKALLATEEKRSRISNREITSRSRTST